MITITVNSKIIQVELHTSVSRMLEIIGNAQDGIAVAVNQQVISKSDWGTYTLQNNDSILIIKATQGG